MNLLHEMKNVKDKYRAEHDGNVVSLLAARTAYLCCSTTASVKQTPSVVATGSSCC
jgi:hypothetical protein